MMSASSSFASITALCILGNARQIGRSKSVMFDAQIYVGSAENEAILGALRYFNGDDTVFPDEGMYMVYATVAHTDPAVEIYPSELYKKADYSLMGDITWLLLLGPTQGPGSELTASINPCRRAYVHVTGPAYQANTEAATFQVDAEQYIATVKDANDQRPKANAIKPIFPTFCFIPDGPRWKNRKKPVPYNKRFVFVSGYLAGITSSLEKNVIQERFKIEVDNVAFLGTHVPPAEPSTPAVDGSSEQTPAPVSKKFRYSYKTPAKRALGDSDVSSSPAGA